LFGKPDPYGYSLSFYRYIVFKDPNWTCSKRPVNFDADINSAEAQALSRSAIRTPTSVDSSTAAGSYCWLATG
jgi:hypothetical protein